MSVRNASATWNGTLNDGSGTMKLGSGLYEGSFSFASRFESGPGTNPEELIGAAHAGCFSMFLSALLSGDGFTPTSVNTTAAVHLTDGPAISKIEFDLPGRSSRTVCRSVRRLRLPSQRWLSCFQGPGRRR